MKVSVNEVETQPAFKAFDLVIRVESQEEAEALHAIHSHVAICEPTPMAYHADICQSLRNACNSSGCGPIWKALKKSIDEYNN